MKTFLRAALLLALTSTAARAQVNAGDQKPEASLPFTMTQVATFNLPWRIAFLPDGRMLITEKVGPVWLVTQQGAKTPVANVPAVLYQGQGGMLGVFLSPHYATDHNVYLTYCRAGRGRVEPGARARAAGDRRGHARAWTDCRCCGARCRRARADSSAPQIAFSPDGQYLFLTVGERQRMTPAQDPDQALGKILRLTLDGKPAPGNPMAGKTGAASVPLIDPPTRYGSGEDRARGQHLHVPRPNLAPAETWTSGHRTPYGLAFAPDGRLWEVEHGPRGGDELNLIEPGKNYGWPLVSYAVNYNGVPIPSPDTRPDLTKPVIYWTPIIAPGNLTFYNGAMFPQWKGSALIGGMASLTLNRVTFDGKGGATPAERWSVGHRIRDVEVASGRRACGCSRTRIPAGCSA